ncbi:MAG: hypothetical protein H0W61_13300 [Bacteroidetes bacterium]|nr:hypothetical protein [Bacteroidota bacterium]
MDNEIINMMFYWILILLFGLSFPVLIILSIVKIEKHGQQSKKFFKVMYIIAECAFIGVMPGIGIAITNDPCGEHPFEIISLNTTYALWIIFAIAYFLSRYLKKYFSPVFISLLASFMVIGQFFCLAVCIHFIPLVMVISIPGLNLLYLSPFFSLYFLLREIIHLNEFFRSAPVDHAIPLNAKVEFFNNWLRKYYLGFSIVFTAPLLLLVQAILYLLGQKPDSIISQFTDSCGFLLSHYNNCSCGGDHYLCSIAANGNKKLVKPTRFGLRANQKIVVNRQLLIANAFENWLEEYVPRLHRVIRKTYDSLNIPVNKWSKHKYFANILYVMMKPLEWFFLLWLYCFDCKPENRIASQYLPAKEFKMYINSESRNEKARRK